MPLVYQQNINFSTKLGIWHITEDENFFLQKVPLQKEVTHWHKRLQHLAGRFLLQELFPDFPVELIRIAFTNKPFLADEAYHFSISHCGDYAAVIVSKIQRVGIDIEHLTDKAEKIRHKFLSENEMCLIGIHQQQLFFTMAWSIKEALYKWYSLGKIDFKKNLLIKAINFKENSGVAHCVFLKEYEKKLTANCLIFNDNCITWINE